MSDLPLAVDLARLQFAFTIAFHIVFPALTIGLASWLALLEGLWLLRRREVYMRLWRHWSIVFALAFAMGVVSGVVMSYQIGTNWGPFADRTGPVLGPLFAYEVMSAFFLEAGFLGVMLFGRKLVGERLHFAATLMVALGTLASAFWILAANSWMHTPAGFAEAGGQLVPVDWWAIVFNPSFPYRLVHMVLAAYLTAALVIAAASAWQVLCRRDGEAARTALRMAVIMVAVAAPLQLVAGDLHGLNTLRHQPAKIAAMEGYWETQRGAPLHLFGWPDMEQERTRWAVGIPRAGSLILTHDTDGEVVGLKAWPRDERPNATLVFWTFRLMVALGLAMIAIGVAGAWLALRGRLATSRLYLRCMVAMGPAGFVALLAGWVTTEAGRQPWVVHGLMRTVEAVSPVAAPAVAASLTAFVLVYLVVFGAGIAYLLRLLARSPDAAPDEAEGTA